MPTYREIVSGAALGEEAATDYMAAQLAKVDELLEQQGPDALASDRERLAQAQAAHHQAAGRLSFQQEWSALVSQYTMEYPAIFRTDEGQAAFNQAIEYLKQREPNLPLAQAFPRALTRIQVTRGLDPEDWGQQEGIAQIVRARRMTPEAKAEALREAEEANANSEDDERSPEQIDADIETDRVGYIRAEMERRRAGPTNINYAAMRRQEMEARAMADMELRRQNGAYTVNED